MGPFTASAGEHPSTSSRLDASVAMSNPVILSSNQELRGVLEDATVLAESFDGSAGAYMGRWSSNLDLEGAVLIKVATGYICTMTPHPNSDVENAIAWAQTRRPVRAPHVPDASRDGKLRNGVNGPGWLVVACYGDLITCDHHVRQKERCLAARRHTHAVRGAAVYAVNVLVPWCVETQRGTYGRRRDRQAVTVEPGVRRTTLGTAQRANVRLRGADLPPFAARVRTTTAVMRTPRPQVQI